MNKAHWILDRNGNVVGLTIPDLYGMPRTLSPAEVMGRFSVEQIRDMRASLSAQLPKN